MFYFFSFLIFLDSIFFLFLFFWTPFVMVKLNKIVLIKKHV